jgi:hypothetical protein
MVIVKKSPTLIEGNAVFVESIAKSLRATLREVGQVFA